MNKIKSFSKFTTESLDPVKDDRPIEYHPEFRREEEEEEEEESDGSAEADARIEQIKIRNQGVRLRNASRVVK